MKKGFTMIELIFVIVILGILASVAIPRLAATREDAEISAAVANLRTLVSDVTAYYTAKGTLTGANWSAITNVPFQNASDTLTATTDANLKVGDDKECIKVKLVDKNNGTPAHIKFTKKSSPNGVCKQVLESAPVTAYINSEVTKTNGKESNAIAVGSSTSVYTTTK